MIAGCFCVDAEGRGGAECADGCGTARWNTTAGGPDWVARCFIMGIITYFTNTLETRPARRTR